MLTWFTLPNATTTMTEVGTYSSALFDQLLPILYVVVGLAVGGMLVAAIIRAAMRGSKRALAMGGRKGRRR